MRRAYTVQRIYIYLHVSCSVATDYMHTFQERVLRDCCIQYSLLYKTYLLNKATSIDFSRMNLLCIY
jgi:hypothetical protein